MWNPKRVNVTTVTHDCVDGGRRRGRSVNVLGGGKKARNGTYKIAYGRFMNTTLLTEY